MVFAELHGVVLCGFFSFSRFQEKIDLREASINFLEEPAGGQQTAGFFHNALYIKLKKGSRTFILGKKKSPADLSPFSSLKDIIS